MDTKRKRLSVIVTVVGVVAAVASAAAMHDHVRLVEIVGLFASGVGTGAGIVATLTSRTREVSV